MSQPPTSSDSTQRSLQNLRTLRKATVLGFVAVALLLLLIAFSLVDRRLQREVAFAEATVSTLQNERLRYQTPEPAVLALMGTLTTTRALAEEIRLAVPTSGLHWPQLVTALDRYDRERIMLTSLTESNRRITLTGQAVNDEAVVGYAQTIEESNLFTAVVVQSIRIIPAPTATALPTATMTPATVTASSVAGAASTEPTLPPLLATATTLAEFVIIVELD